MKTRRILVIVVVLVLVLFAGVAAVALVGYSLLSPHSSHNQASAIDCTLEWARVNPFPKSATGLRIEVRGSAFTRGFVVEFDAPLSDINAWIAASPGPSAVIPTRDGLRRKYAISPGGGADFAELTVDDATGHVRIYTYWS